MGTIFALTYAMLSMGYFELTFYWICINEFGEMLSLIYFGKLVQVSRWLQNNLIQN